MCNMCRHRRETHKRRARACAHHRQSQQRTYQRVIRNAAILKESSKPPRSRVRVPVPYIDRTIRCHVLCPGRREVENEMYSTTRQSLATIGAPPDSIHREVGWDFRTGEHIPEHIPKLIPSKWLHVWFYYAFLPAVEILFRDDPELEYVCYVEDDAKPAKGVTFQKIATALRLAGKSVSWLGYSSVGGQPRYGSQIIGLSRYCATWQIKYMAANIDPDDPWKFFVGLDTYFWKLYKDKVKMPNGDLAVVVPPTSLVGQRGHRLKGRQ